MRMSLALLVWRPPLGGLGSGLLLLFLAAWLAWIYRRLRKRHGPARAMRLLIPKLLLFILLLLALFDPTWSIAPEPAQRRLLALVDASSSMNTADESGVTRRQRAETIVDDVAQQLGDGYEILRLYAATGITAAPPPIGETNTVYGTDPGAWLAEIVRLADREGLAAALILTDGGDSRVAIEQRPKIPMYVVGIGGDLDGRKDVRISEAAAPRTVDRNVEFPITVTVRASGAGAPDRHAAEITLALDERTKGGFERIARHTGRPTDDELRHTFTLPSGSTSRHRYFRVSVAPVEGEASTLNNRRRLTVEVRRRIVNAFLYADTLNWEVRYLRKLLQDDPGVRLTSYEQVANGRSLLRGAAVTGNRPASGATQVFEAEALDRYQCVLLASRVTDDLSSAEQTALADYVDRGGTLVLMGHAVGTLEEQGRTSPLADLSPWRNPFPAVLRRGRFPLSPARGSAGHPLVRNTMAPFADRFIPRLSAVRKTGPLKPAAIGLFDASVRGTPRSVIALQGYGRGAVLGIAASTLWRWHREGGAHRQAYEEFWKTVLRYLGGQVDAGRFLTVDWDRSLYQPGEEAEVRLAVAGTPALGTIRVEGRLLRKGEERSLPVDVAPGLAEGFRSRFTFPRRGTYTVRFDALAGPRRLERYEKTVDVGARLDEGAVLEVDDEFLQDLARRSRDRYVREANYAELIPEIRNQAVPATVFARRFLLQTHGIYLALVLAVLLGEWLLRRKYNLF